MSILGREGKLPTRSNFSLDNLFLIEEDSFFFYFFYFDKRYLKYGHNFIFDFVNIRPTFLKNTSFWRYFDKYE